MLRSVLTALLIAATLAPAVPAGHPADDDDDEKTGNDLVKVRVLADRPRIRAGERFHVAFVFTIEPHWHIYWKNAGDSGWPTEIALNAPAGFEVGEALFPRPSIFREGDGTTYGYEKQCVLFVPVTAPPALDDGEAVFSARVDWTVCKSICLFGRADLTLSAPTTSAPASANPAPAPMPDRALETSWRRLPALLRELPGAACSFDRAASALRITGPARSEGAVVGFLPVDRPGIRFAAARSRVHDGRFELTVPVKLDPGLIEGTSPTLEGLFIIGEDPDDPSYDVKVTLP